MRSRSIHNVATCLLVLSTAVQADWRDVPAGSLVRIQMSNRDAELTGTVSDVVDEGLYVEDAAEQTLWLIHWGQIESLSVKVEDHWRPVPDAIPAGGTEPPPQLQPGVLIRVRGIELDAWVTGPLVRVDADSLVMIDDLIGEKIAVPMTPRLRAQAKVLNSTGEVRRRHAMYAGSVVGGFLSIGVLGCLQGCENGDEVDEAMTTTIVATGVAALIGYMLPAREGASWRDVPLTPTLTITPDHRAMLTLQWRR